MFSDQEKEHTDPVAVPSTNRHAVEDKVVQIHAILATKIGFASHQNSVAVVRDLSVINSGKETSTDLSLELTSDPPFLAPKAWHIDRLDAGATLQVTDRDIRLNAGLLHYSSLWAS